MEVERKGGKGGTGGQWVRAGGCKKDMCNKIPAKMNSLLVSLIEKSVCPLERQIVQVMSASVQHPSKPCWDAQAHNEHPWSTQQQCCPKMVSRKADLRGILSPVVHCSLQAPPKSIIEESVEGQDVRQHCLATMK